MLLCVLEKQSRPMPSSRMEARADCDPSSSVEPEPSTDGSAEGSSASTSPEATMRAGETAAAPNPSSKIEVRCDLDELSTKSESSPSFDEVSEETVDDLDLELESFRRARDLSRRSLSLGDGRAWRR